MKIFDRRARPLITELGLHEARDVETSPEVPSRWYGYLAGGVATSLLLTGGAHPQRDGPPAIVAVRTADRFEIPPYTELHARNDSALARIFGGPTSVAAGNGYEPKGLRTGSSDGYRGALFEGDLGHLQRSLHVYGSDDSNTAGPLYIPPGFEYLGAMTTPNGRENGGHSFFYRRLGTKTSVVLRVFHVKDFAIDRKDRNEAGSIRIGDIGGPGGAPYPGTEPAFQGQRRDYIHAHLEILKGRSNRNDAHRFPFHEVFPSDAVVPPARR